MECKEKARGGIMGVGGQVVNGEMNWTHCHACVLGGKAHKHKVIMGEAESSLGYVMSVSFPRATRLRWRADKPYVHGP